MQEACIGYNSGSLISVGIADIALTPQGLDAEMSELSEETKDEGLSYIDTMNFAMF